MTSPGARSTWCGGIADPKKVGILGVHTAATPHSQALRLLRTLTPPRWTLSVIQPDYPVGIDSAVLEPIRKLFYERMGDPNTPEGKALLTERSPLTYANKITNTSARVQGETIARE